MPAVAAHPLGHRPIFTEDHDALRDSVRRFVATEVTPALAGWRQSGQTPRAVVAAAGAAGLLGITAPEEFGGGGVDDRGFLTVLIEETVDVGATGLALLWAMHSGVALPAVAAHTDPGIQQRWLPGLTSGELIGLPVPLTRVSAAGDSLTGEVRNVPFGRVADLLVGTLPTGAVVLIPTHADGVHVTDVEDNLAAPDAGLSDITLDDVRVQTLPDGASTRGDLNVWFAVIALASARYALGLAVDYTRERTVFGRPLADFENTRLRLARLAADLSTTTSFVDDCLAAAAGLDDASAAVACLTAGELHDRCVDQALQLHGGYGYMREYPISTAFADARFLRLLTRQYTDVPGTIARDLGL